MSVLVKDWEMPGNCDVCLFSDWSNLHRTCSCMLKHYEPVFPDFSRDFEIRRSNICPLVEIPPHGDLIDAEKLFEKTAEWEAQALEQAVKHSPIEEREEWLWWSAVLKERGAFKHDIMDAEVVIKREEEE